MLSTVTLTVLPLQSRAADPTFLGIWSRDYSSKDIITPVLGIGSTFIIDVNATNLPPVINSTYGGINGFDVTVKYDPSILNATDADFRKPLCPATEGCLFDKPDAFPVAQKLNSTTGTVQLAVVLFGLTRAEGSGVLFRIEFYVRGTGLAAIDIREEISSLAEPNGRIILAPYTAVDGSFNNVGANTTPTASFTTYPLSPVIGGSVSFDASQSSDPDGTISSYAWDFGDSATGTGKQVTHVYQAAGVYTVRLTVTDNMGTVAAKTGTVTVTSVETGGGGGNGNGSVSPVATLPITLGLAASISAALLLVLLVFLYARHRSERTPADGPLAAK